MDYRVKGNFSHITENDIKPHLAEPLKPYAGDFAIAGHENNLDPRFLASISMLETSRGTSSAFRNKNNAMGISDRDGPIHCDSVPDSIRRQAHSLSREGGYYENAYTIEEIGAIYSPPGASNDVHETNSGWPSHVTQFYVGMLQNSSGDGTVTAIVREYVEPPPLPRVMHYRHRGEDVKYVQTLLQQQGYFQGTPLGNFLSLTRNAVRYFQNTHIGKDGNFLEVDGEVGEQTWWALHNPAGSAQRNFVDSADRAAVASPEREAVLKFLYDLYTEGVREIPNGSNYGDGVTRIVNACGFRYGIYWCLAVQSYAEREANGAAPLGAMHVHCSTFWNLAHSEGMAHPKGNYTPIPGDIAIYNYGSGLRRNGRVTGSGHAGRVARVSQNGRKFNMLEGNAGNRLKYSIRRVNESSLIGYINLYGDKDNPPQYARGITDAPEITLSLADSR